MYPCLYPFSSVGILTLAVKKSYLSDAVDFYRFHLALDPTHLYFFLMLNSRFMKIHVICEDYPFRHSLGDADQCLHSNNLTSTPLHSIYFNC